MGAIIDFIVFALLFLLVVAVFVAFIIGFKYLTWFHWRSCKYCGRNMAYMGLREGEKGHHYLFHCEHCGSWEQVPVEEFIHSLDKDCNPNVA